MFPGCMRPVSFTGPAELILKNVNEVNGRRRLMFPVSPVIPVVMPGSKLPVSEYWTGVFTTENRTRKIWRSSERAKPVPEIHSAWPLAVREADNISSFADTWSTKSLMLIEPDAIAAPLEKGSDSETATAPESLKTKPPVRPFMDIELSYELVAPAEPANRESSPKLSRSRTTISAKRVFVAAQDPRIRSARKCVLFDMMDGFSRTGWRLGKNRRRPDGKVPTENYELAARRFRRSGRTIPITARTGTRRKKNAVSRARALVPSKRRVIGMPFINGRISGLAQRATNLESGSLAAPSPPRYRENFGKFSGGQGNSGIAVPRRDGPEEESATDPGATPGERPEGYHSHRECEGITCRRTADY